LGRVADGRAAVNLTLELTAEQLAELAQEVAPLVLAHLTERDGPSPWLSLAEGAAYLGVSERTLEREITRERLRSTTLGRRRLLHRDDLDALARSGDGGGNSANRSHPATARGVE
jgi:excisionase family DNA binding protein